MHSSRIVRKRGDAAWENVGGGDGGLLGEVMCGLHYRAAKCICGERATWYVEDVRYIVMGLDGVYKGFWYSFVEQELGL